MPEQVDTPKPDYIETVETRQHRRKKRHLSPARRYEENVQPDRVNDQGGVDTSVASGQPLELGTSGPNAETIRAVCFIDNHKAAHGWAIQAAWDRIGNPAEKPVKPANPKDVTFNGASLNQWFATINENSSPADKKLVARIAATLGLNPPKK